MHAPLKQDDEVEVTLTSETVKFIRLPKNGSPALRACLMDSSCFFRGEEIKK